jgi:hypothetical protein
MQNAKGQTTIEVIFLLSILVSLALTFIKGSFYQQVIIPLTQKTQSSIQSVLTPQDWHTYHL